MSTLRLVSTMLVFAVLGCAQQAGPPADAPEAAHPEPAVPPTVEQHGQVRVALPAGAPNGGRQAFLDLKCTVCHSVAGETDFPEPFSANPGPRLDATLASRPSGYVATAITAPSHSISVNVSDEVKAQMEGVLSPMVDYSDVMTVRQMVDLLAYLDGLSE